MLAASGRPREDRHEGRASSPGARPSQDGRDEVDARQQTCPGRRSAATTGSSRRPRPGCRPARTRGDRQASRCGANSPTPSEILMSRAPAAVSQKTERVHHRKRPTSRPHRSAAVPRKFIKPTTNGMAMKKIMIVPCAEKDLVVVLGRQEACATAGGQRLLRAHHDRVAEAAQQHHQGQQDVHDAHALVVHRGQPLDPQPFPSSEPGQKAEHERGSRSAGPRTSP